MTAGLVTFGPLAVRLGGGSRSARAAVLDMLRGAASTRTRGGDVELDVALAEPRPRQWSQDRPGWYEVDHERATIHMEVADWTAEFLLSERRTCVTFRELWYPGVEHFFKMLVQTWLPLCGLGLAFHASAVVFRRRCLLFPARAETGKTTVARVLRQHGGTVVTEEMACCAVSDASVMLQSLPFRERSGLNSLRGVSAELDQVYSLRQSRHDRVQPVADTGPAALLLARNAAVGFRETEIMTPAMDICVHLARRVPVAILEFTRGPRFVDVIESHATSPSTDHGSRPAP